MKFLMFSGSIFLIILMPEILQVMDRALFHSDATYKIPNIRVTGHVCKTNIPSNTAFRGFGGPQGMFIAETWIEHIAKSLDVPAKQVTGFRVLLNLI